MGEFLRRAKRNNYYVREFEAERFRIAYAWTTVAHIIHKHLKD
jgi:hypothetical protein